MSELIGNGPILKRADECFWVKSKDGWMKVCSESDPMWGQKCVQMIEYYYPEKK